MQEEIRELLKRYYKIKNKGYIKSVNNLKNGSGLTLEHYLNATGGDICIPDFKSIELKTLRSKSISILNLFSSSPDGKYILATQWLSENYGYPDKDYKDIKIISGNVKEKLNKIGLLYYFSLFIDYNNKKIILKIYNNNKELINSDLYWDFDSIEEKLIRKLSFLAIIKNKRKKLAGEYYYSFCDINIYKLKSFETFLKLIDKGIVSISFKTGIYKSGNKIGKFHDHGTSFNISIKDIKKLYNKIY